LKGMIGCVIPLLALSALHEACTRPQATPQVPPSAQPQASQAPSTAQTSAAAKVFSGAGVVEGVDKSIDTIQINHGDIKGYMPAMSMPYRVKDKAMLDLVKPGDKVTFTLEDTSKGAVLIEIKKTEP
jgi:Cu(I)/Ag(I) efflux system protein CusF